MSEHNFTVRVLTLQKPINHHQAIMTKLRKNRFTALKNVQYMGLIGCFYLTTGGATVWPYLGVAVFPEKGSAVMWYNTKNDGVPDHLTLHAACPVLLGQKWSTFVFTFCQGNNALKC